MKANTSVWQRLKAFGLLVSAVGFFSAATHAGSVSVAVYKSTIAENGKTVRVTLTNNEDARVTYHYWTVGGTATPSVDFQAANGNATIDMFESHSFNLAIYNDSLVENTETFQVCAGFAQHAEDCATVTIIDDDKVSPGVSFKISDVNANEYAGTMRFTVTKTGNDGLAHSVNFATANGTANSVSDYVSKSDVLNFSAATTSLPVTVTLRDNFIPESAEYFYVNLSNPTGGATLSDAQGKGTILDDDDACPGVCP